MQCRIGRVLISLATQTSVIIPIDSDWTTSHIFKKEQK
jgi:hypothetical protein